MGENQKFQLGTVGALGLSVVSSVSIVICNKALISTLGFTFGKFFASKSKFCFVFNSCFVFKSDLVKERGFESV